MTKLTIDLADILKRKHPHGFHAPADLDIDTFLEFADDDWEHELDVHELLAEGQQIAVVWDIEDVQSLRPDLTDDQAWDVLRVAGRRHDANTGLNWDVLAFHAENLFPAPDDDVDEPQKIEFGLHDSLDWWWNYSAVQQPPEQAIQIGGSTP